MQRLSPPRPGIVFLLLLSAALLGCGGAVPPPPGGELVTAPLPDLDAVDPWMARTLRQLHTTAEELRLDPDAAPEELLEAFGALGKHLAAYGFLDAAAISLQNAQTLDPEDADWPHLLGVVAFDGSELAAAAGHFQRVLELRPDQPAALIHSGITQLELDRPEAARQPLERALELDPDSLGAHYWLGQLEMTVGADARAIGHFERVLELQGEASTVHHSLAQLYRRQGDLGKARLSLDRAGDREVRWHDPLLAELGDLINLSVFEIVKAKILDRQGFSADDTLSYAQTHLGDVAGAVESIEAYLENLRLQAGEVGQVDPLIEARFHYVLGGMRVYQENDPAALEHFRRAVALAPDFLAARIKLGNVLVRSGELEEALRQYSAALTIAPENLPARLRRGTLYLKRRELAAALDDLGRAAEIAPGDAGVRSKLAVARLLSGDGPGFERERAAAFATEQDAGERAALSIVFGKALTAVGRFEEAAEEYREALGRRAGGAPRHDQSGDSRAALAALAGVEGHLGLYAEALGHYRQLLQLAPQDAEARRGEIAALLLLERRGEAHPRLEAALRELEVEQQPVFADALARLLAAAPEAELRDGRRAVALARAAFRLRRTPRTTETLAMALAEAGRFEEARTLQGAMIEEIERQGASFSLVLPRRRLRDYEAARPWRAISPVELLPAG